jgi:hypothetical protein
MRKELLTYHVILMFVFVMFFTMTGASAQTSQNIEELPAFPEYLVIPKYSSEKPYMLSDMAHCVYDRVFFSERLIPEELRKNTNEYESMKKYSGHILKLFKYGEGENYIRDYIVHYPSLHDKDVFPLPGAIYCFHRHKPKEEHGQYVDAFLIKKDKYPEGVDVGYGTFILPLNLPKEIQKRTYLFNPISVIGIEQDDKGNLRTQIKYSPVSDGKLDQDKEFVTRWYRKDDIISFSRLPRQNKEREAISLTYWPSQAKGGPFGLRIIRIVPRDPYPIRDIGKVKGRLIGWIELENRPIPLDNNGKPLNKEK